MAIRSFRLSDRLDASARLHADYLGITVNALLCVALDAYLKSQLAPGHDGVTYPLPPALVQAHAGTNGVPPGCG
jgi:hypothetical protein